MGHQSMEPVALPHILEAFLRNFFHPLYHLRHLQHLPHITHSSQTIQINDYHGHPVKSFFTSSNYMINIGPLYPTLNWLLHPAICFICHTIVACLPSLPPNNSNVPRLNSVIISVNAITEQKLTRQNIRLFDLSSQIPTQFSVQDYNFNILVSVQDLSLEKY